MISIYLQLRNAFEAGVSRANKLAVSQAQVIKKWVVLPKDFSIPGGELGKGKRTQTTTLNVHHLSLSYQIQDRNIMSHFVSRSNTQAEETGNC
jgi:hypothetical protein